PPVRRARRRTPEGRGAGRVGRRRAGLEREADGAGEEGESREEAQGNRQKGDTEEERQEAASESAGRVAPDGETTPMKPRGSRKATAFTESVIREMTRLAQRHGAVNLAQGFPDFAAPQAIKDAACAAVS